MAVQSSLHDNFKLRACPQRVQPRIARERRIAKEAFIHCSRKNNKSPVTLQDATGWATVAWWPRRPCQPIECGKPLGRIGERLPGWQPEPGQAAWNTHRNPWAISANGMVKRVSPGKISVFSLRLE